jgi:hypothetical protein
MVCALLDYRIQLIVPNRSSGSSRASKTVIEPFFDFFPHPIPTVARNEPTVNGRAGG